MFSAWLCYRGGVHIPAVGLRPRDEHGECDPMPLPGVCQVLACIKDSYQRFLR